MEEKRKMREEMMCRLAEAVKEAVGMKCTVQFRKVEKNNGLMLQSVEIREPGMNVAPAIYIDSILERAEAGKISLSDAAGEIADIYRDAKDSCFPGVPDDVAGISKEHILDRVVYQVISSEKNRGRLADLPHKELLDLSVIYRFIVSENKDGVSSIVLNHEICSRYDINEDELDLAAMKNTKEKGFCVMTVEEIMTEITGVSVEECHNELSPMYILTNTTRRYGAAVMLYEEYFLELAGMIKGDLYIMPSSIHEVIAIPAVGSDPDELRRIVTEVNMDVVPEDEVLGESVYRYNSEKGKLEIA